MFRRELRKYGYPDSLSISCFEMGTAWNYKCSESSFPTIDIPSHSRHQTGGFRHQDMGVATGVSIKNMEVGKNATAKDSSM